MRSRALLALATALFVFATAAWVLAQRSTPPPNEIPIDADDIAGVVTSSRGREAGIWVIAETDDTPTKFRKIVVTDDAGRFLLPDLPARGKTSYRVWTRGYGLVDSSPVRAMPGRRLTLKANVAPTARAAALVYPANYWLSLIDLPPREDFPGTGPTGNGIGVAMKSQYDWINEMKDNCAICHQVGTRATREFPPALGTFSSGAEAWERRIRVGQDGQGMLAAFDNLGHRRSIQMFTKWTDRIAAGDVPPAPPRPQGVERNVVITMWDWGGSATFAHDELSSDKRNPTANAYGPIYGVDEGTDKLLSVDPLEHAAAQVNIPVVDPKTPSGKAQAMLAPSPYWGDKPYWFDPALANHGALDVKGRIWLAARFRVPDNQPDFCKDHPSSALAPQPSSFRQIQYFDPRTRQFKQVNTCFETHHIQFAADSDETLYANGVFNGAIGWIKTRVLDETGDERAAQGWCRPYFDVNQDGRIDPTVDRPVMPLVTRWPDYAFYSVIPHPDGNVWGASPAPMPGRIIRIDPKTCTAEVYEPPFDPATEVVGYTPRGIDIDSDGVIWTALAGSGHLASFDRRKCRVLRGAEATNGQHCREGWTLYPTPGPRFKGIRGNIGIDYHYYNFVDRFDTLGLGRDTRLANGTNSDSLLALRADGTWVVLRVPYPLGFFSRGMDGRIDDPNGGWKGRGLYADYGEQAIWHVEGGLGTRSKLVKFQIRPEPLAK